jgi:hypothetical protein
MSLTGTRDEAFDQRAEACLDLGIAGGAQRGDAAAMEGFFVHHDFGPLDALVVAELACQFQRGLVGFQPGGAEKHIAHARRGAPVQRPAASWHGTW